MKTEGTMRGNPDTLIHARNLAHKNLPLLFFTPFSLLISFILKYAVYAKLDT